MKKLVVVMLTAAGALAATQASAAVITFSFSGNVSSFIDVDNVYGFGADANLTGDSVTDVYTIDTSTLTFSTGGLPGDPGSVYNEYGPGGPVGVDSASSTIDGHTITIGQSNGYSLVAYISQTYAPNPYNQEILELQAIGAETTGTAVGSEFLLRDEAVSYSTTALPLSIVSPSGGYTLAPGVDWGGVFFPYAPGASAGFFGAVIPEPATWAMMLVGIGMIGGGLRIARRKHEMALTAT